MNHHSVSRLQIQRQKYVSKLPKILQNLHQIHFEKKQATSSIKNSVELKTLFSRTFGRPVVIGKEGDIKREKLHRIGVVFSGGQASGGHNVVAGLYDALTHLNPKSVLFGFLDGPSGIIENKCKELNHKTIDPYRNQGGFDLISSGRTKIETEEQLKASLETVRKLNLDGLVIIGGDDSNTNAAVLAEYFLQNGSETCVVGVPKTIDGDLKNASVATSFGFDTACKVYAELIGNIARDALSAKKYTHFIKLMGRSASHIALECALATQANITLIGEEIAEKNKTLIQIVGEISDVICKRAEKDKNYGIVLIPEGVIEFIPEMKFLISELNQLASQGILSLEQVNGRLNGGARKTFEQLPLEIRKQLLLERDPHGNVQVSLIETEKLIMQLVAVELENRKKQGTFKGKFAAQNHFFGYEGRAGFPSNFDTHYCTALGFTAALLIDDNLTGYMACIQGLDRPVNEWKIGGIPITMLMHLEMRKGKQKPVIQKALVDLKGKPYAYFQKNSLNWATEDLYRFPGPIQFFGDSEITDSIPISLQLENL